MERLPIRRHVLIVLVITAAFRPFFCLAQEIGTYQEEADRLALLLGWQPTSTVADIGAGRGQLALAAQNRWKSTPASFAR